MAQTVVEKIAQAHLAEGPKRPLRAGDFLSIRPFHVMTHDNTSAVMSKFKAIGAKKICDPKQLVFALDHDIQNQDEANLKKYRSIEAFAKEHGVDFYPAGSGIGHQIMVERGYVVPGSFVVASDSHSNMYGALGAIGTPIVRTDAAAVWATGEFWWQIPRTIQVVLEGKLRQGASGKDVIISLCGLYNHDEALNAAIEFSGPGVASLSMDARFSISNMSTEWGPLVGWFPVDEVTIRYLRSVRQRLQEPSVERFTETDIESWAVDPPRPDTDASYAARITLDLAEVTPHVSGPDTVQVMQSLAALERKRVAIQKAYLISCVNSRLEDLEAAAWVLCGKRVAPGVKFYLSAASAWVQQEAERRGIWQTLLDAGATPLPSGCGPCIGLGVGLSGKRRGRNLGHQPQLQRPYGIARCPVLSGKSGSSRGIGGGGIHHGAVSLCGSRAVAPVHRIRREREGVFRKSGNSSRLSGARERPTDLPAAGQREYGCNLRQGLHLPRRHDAGDDGRSRHGELRSAVWRAHSRRGRHRQRVQLRNRVEPRASGDLPQGQGHSTGDRG